MKSLREPVLEFIKKTSRPLTVERLSKELGMSRSAVYHWLKTFVEKGLLIKDRNSNNKHAFHYRKPVFRDKLLEIYYDHENLLRKQFEKEACNCGCPISSTTIPILFQYVAHELGVSSKIIKKGLQYWGALIQANQCVTGNPIAIVAGYTYFVLCQTGCHRNQLTIAKLVGVCEPTVRRYFKIFARLDENRREKYLREGSN